MAEKTLAQDTLLADLYQQRHYSNAMHNYYYTHGLITSVAACPEIPMPERWMRWVLKGKSSKLSSREQEHITHSLITTLQIQLKRMTENVELMPNEEAFSDISLQETTEKHDINSPLSQWCCGLLAGHSQLEEVWLDAWDKMLRTDPKQLKTRQKQLTHVLSMLSTFANVPLAIEQAELKGNTQLKSHLPNIARSLPKAVNEYVDLSGNLVSYLENQFENFIKPAN